MGCVSCSVRMSASWIPPSTSRFSAWLAAHKSDSFSPAYVPAWVGRNCLGGRRCRLVSVPGTPELVPVSVADSFLLPLGFEVTTVLLQQSRILRVWDWETS